MRIAGSGPQSHQNEQRHENRSRPVGYLSDVKGRPARQQHDLDRHYRNGSPGDLTEQCEKDAGEHVTAPGAAPRQDCRSRSRHVGCVDWIPRGFQREISFDRSAEVESAPMKQRPTAIRTLGRANVSRDARLQLGLDAAEVVLEQDELRRDRHVGLELEDPVSVWVLQADQRLAGSHDSLVEPRRANVTAQHPRFVG